MTPLHHHFQIKGMQDDKILISKPIDIVPEAKLVLRFWLIGIILALITIVTLKAR